MILSIEINQRIKSCSEMETRVDRNLLGTCPGTARKRNVPPLVFTQQQMFPLRCPFLYLLTYSFIYLFVYLFIYLFVYLYLFPTYVSFFFFVGLWLATSPPVFRN